MERIDFGQFGPTQNTLWLSPNVIWPLESILLDPPLVTGRFLCPVKQSTN